jgi:glycosyltransferase involved in cell wall biosynthesis
MKIAIDVSQSIYGTGVSQYTKHLITHLLRQDSKNKYVLFGGSLRRKKELDAWINRLSPHQSRTYYLSPNFLHLLWNTFHLLPVETLTGKVDLIHTSDWTEPPSKIPKVTTVHDLNFLVDPKFAHPEIRSVQSKRLFWVAKESAGIIAVSRATKRDLMDHFKIDSDRIEVIYEGPSIEYPPVFPDSEIGALAHRLGIKKPYFLVPGSGHPRKNIVRAIKAFRASGLDNQLIVLGRATAEEKSATAKDVIFADFVSDREYELLMSRTAALFYPSLYEGFGIPVLDAFVCEAPVITSNVSSLPEVAGEAAILVDPESVESMADGLRMALQERNRLVTAGQEQLKRFSWKKTAKETLNFYSKVYANRH